MFKRFMLLAVAATIMCLSAQAQKFGYINTSEIFNVMPDKATAENTLKQVSDKYEAEFKNLQDAFQKKMADYDIIFLGYPIWFGTYANPIITLVKEQDFAGKTIVPFCTFGSGGLNTSSDALKKALPKATIKKGYGVRTARVNAAAKELDRFLKENGYKKGSVEKLPDYSAQQPVTDAERQIFDAACSSYQFPLGTPQTVGKRQTPDGTDYKFTVASRSMNGGGESTSIIYVTVGKDAKPEFTEVVR